MEQSFIVDGIVKWYKVEKQFGNFAKLTNHLVFSSTSPLLSTREVKTYVDQRVVQHCSQKALFRITSPDTNLTHRHMDDLLLYRVYYTTVFHY